jgi:two-component system, OmpR family, sensor histidine kinase BaeS
MIRRLIVSLAVLVAAAAVLAELLLRPANARERLHLVLILATPAAIAVGLAPLLRRWVSSRSSVAGAALVVGLCSLALGAVSSSAASNAMFVSAHDYRLFLVVLLMSCGIALAVGSQLTRPLALDIARLGDVARRVADGDLAVRTGIDRNDEVGRTAAAIDSMVNALAVAARERDRMADARQMLFTSIGHDLRTPLSAIRAAVESVQDGLADDPDRYMTVIGNELGNVEALLDQLIEYARIESGQRQSGSETVSVAEVASEAVEALEPLARRRGVRLELHTDGPAFVTATTLDVRRALRNPLENAIGHCRADGVVSVRVHEHSAGVDVQILDDGPGFPPGFKDRAFEPFTRADLARTSGTGHAAHAGLGLAITRGLVQQHGGRAWIGDGPGGDIRLTFPPKEHT